MVKVHHWRGVAKAADSRDGAAMGDAVATPASVAVRRSDARLIASGAEGPRSVVARRHLGASDARGPDLAGLRVLHVDDDATVIDAVRSRLEDRGVHYIGTSAPREALRLLRERRRFDVFITDLVMPELDGIQLLDTLLHERRFIPTLALSGSQGKSRAAVTWHQLGGAAWADLPVPLRYMKKTVDHFEADLVHHLDVLRRTPRRHLQLIRTALLPQLRSVIAGAKDGPELPTDLRRRRIFEAMLDSFCDRRFTLLLEADPFFDELATAMAGRADTELIARLARCRDRWHRIPVPARDEILGFNQMEWHTFKGRVCGYHNAISLMEDSIRTRDGLDAVHMERLHAIFQRCQALARLGNDLGDLRKVGRSQESVDVLATLRQSGAYEAGLAAKRRDAAIALDVPEDGLIISVPNEYVDAIVHQLLLNASQAMTGERPWDPGTMTLRSRIVARDDWASALALPSAASDLLGNRFRPALTASRYWYFGVLNPGASIAPEVREHLLAGTRVTTKAFGSGMGMTFIHELLREMEGSWLSVQSYEGQNEIGVFTPIPD